MFSISVFSLIGLFLTFFSLPAAHAVTINGGGGLTVSVDSSGAYEVTVPDISWRFSGDAGSSLANIQVTPSADALGGYNEISFDFQSGPARHGAIRSYWDHANVVFTVKYSTAAANTFSFPNWTQFPRNLDHLTYSGIFAPPSFGNLANESPWIFFDASFNTFILSPARNFMTASTGWGPKGELASGIVSEIAVLPQGFEHSTLLVVEKGINRAFDTWGQALTALHGKTRPANDSDPSLNKIGYWTDNGAAYYYRMADKMNYEETLSAVKANFDSLGIGLGYVQLDSWFYPKGSGALWSNNGQGIYQYTAATPPFRNTLSRFQQSLGVPLVTHARWIDESSPYRKLYKMSGNVVLDTAYWNTVAGYLAAAGVATYEQDWLADKAHTDFNLTDGDMFLDNMAAAMAQRRLTMQYCMASPRHFLQSSKYSNLTTIRTSADRLTRDRWTDFLYTSRLASALGAWPFTDNFLSTETTHMLLAALSAGPVGIGDPISSISGVNLLRAVRRDGVIVKPDIALTPIDSSYRNMANSVDTPQVASTYSDFGALRTYYVFAYSQGANSQARISPSDIGANGPVYFYDYFVGDGQVADASDVIQKPIVGDAAYLVLAPIGPSGMAILGDVDQFVTMGKKRVPAMTDDGAVRLTVAFADGETTRTISGYSPFAPTAHAAVGAVGQMTYDAATGQFHVPVMPGADGAAAIVIQNRRARTEHRPVRRPLRGGPTGSAQ